MFSGNRTDQTTGKEIEPFRFDGPRVYFEILILKSETVLLVRSSIPLLPPCVCDTGNTNGGRYGGKDKDHLAYRRQS
jgi:hypothetical protein